MDKQHLYKYLLLLGDNSMILGQRLSELCGHGPNLETDIALTNISLDLFGQVRSYFKYAATLSQEDATEDTVAFLRYERDYYNCLLLEQPNTDFAYVITRQFLYDAYHKPLLEQLTESQDTTIAAIAAKSIKESKYHLRFSSEWIKRLGQGTEESHLRLQNAVDDLYPYSNEFLEETEIEKIMSSSKIGADLNIIAPEYRQTVNSIFNEAGIKIANTKFRVANGKTGMHSEQLGFILSDFQYMQRTYPNMAW